MHLHDARPAVPHRVPGREPAARADHPARPRQGSRGAVRPACVISRTAVRDLLERPPVSLSGQFDRVPTSGCGRPAIDRRRPHPRARSSAPGWLDARQHGDRARQPDRTGSPTSPRSELTNDPSAFMRRSRAARTDPRAFAELVDSARRRRSVSWPNHTESRRSGGSQARSTSSPPKGRDSTGSRAAALEGPAAACCAIRASLRRSPNASRSRRARRRDAPLGSGSLRRPRALPRARSPGRARGARLRFTRALRAIGPGGHTDPSRRPRAPRRPPQRPRAPVHIARGLAAPALPATTTRPSAPLVAGVRTI